MHPIIAAWHAWRRRLDECRAAFEYGYMGSVSYPGNRSGKDTFHVRDVEQARSWFNEVMHHHAREVARGE